MGHPRELTTTHAQSLALKAKLFRGFAEPSRLSAAVVTRRRAPCRFRAAALLAVLGMIQGWMEIAVPDVHDGHGDAEPEAGAWIQLSHGLPPALPEEPGHAPQAPHSCHCIHTHAPALPAAADDSSRPAFRHPGVCSMQRALASVAPEPHFRPPVA